MKHILIEEEGFSQWLHPHPNETRLVSFADDNPRCKILDIMIINNDGEIKEVIYK